VPDFDDSEQKAKDHGNLMDEGVAEVEREADEAARGQDHGLADKAAKPRLPPDLPTGAAAFSEAELAEEASESQKTQNGPAEPTGSDEQAAELLAEQTAEGEDSVT
jgi:hypothetical protein